jgi:hypothetical protein
VYKRPRQFIAGTSSLPGESVLGIFLDLSAATLEIAKPLLTPVASLLSISSHSIKDGSSKSS